MAHNPKAQIIPIPHEGKTFYLIQDHAVIGGTKTRGLYQYIKSKPQYAEFIYAGPATGNAQFALAYCCSLLGKRATVFLSSVPRVGNTEPTKNALKYGIHIAGKFATLAAAQEASKEYAAEDPERLLCPFGLDDEEFIEILRANLRSAFSADFAPSTIWITVGSGTVLRTLLRLFPNAKYKCVLVGRNIWEDQFTAAQWAQLTLYRAPEKFHENAKFVPPYESLRNYDAKLWRFVAEFGQDGDHIWNVY